MKIFIISLVLGFGVVYSAMKLVESVESTFTTLEMNVLKTQNKRLRNVR